MKKDEYLNGLGKAVAIIGSQWGDEGKGKLVDILAEKYSTIVRGTGGANAGHTIIVNGVKHVFHLLPSGILYQNNACVIGPGCVLDLETLFMELDRLQASNINVDNRLFISDRAHIVFDFHKMIDEYSENQKADAKIGTTKRGIGPCYADKISRVGIRISDLYEKDLFVNKLKFLVERNKSHYNINVDLDALVTQYGEWAQRLKPFVLDTTLFLNDRFINESSSGILLEGANATHLDIDHGTYPFVTSSNASIAGLLSGCGFQPKRLTDIIGIVKAYTTRVGSGPFLTELHDELGELIRANGKEFGSTTGRPRRCGWFDAVLIRTANLINGFTSLNLTKLDVLSEIPVLKIASSYSHENSIVEYMPSSLSVHEQCEVNYIELEGFEGDISQCSSFADLPLTVQNYVLAIEDLCHVKINTIGVGPERHQMIYR